MIPDSPDALSFAGVLYQPRPDFVTTDRLSGVAVYEAGVEGHQVQLGLSKAQSILQKFFIIG